MSTYVQKGRPLSVTTPVGKDILLLTELSGSEGLSELFHFQLQTLAKNGTNVAFDKLLGQKITATLTLPNDKQRYFSGICNRVSEGARDAEFTGYRLDIVPQAWLMTKRAQSRIFQHKSAPDILKKVFEGVDVAFELQGSFKPRDYCVQYRETDFNFACRLMEEEGFYYFFKHSADGCKMVVANSPQSHSDMPEQNKILFDPLDAGHGRKEDRIFSWEKSQELRSGKYLLWDHSFELPHKHLEAEKATIESVAVGKVQHKLKIGVSDKLEIYDFPGEYAQRFDGVDNGGGDRAADLQNIFQDNKRTVEIRMQEETAPSVLIQGRSSCRNFVSGHKFTLERHHNAEGQYVLVRVQHSASMTGQYRSGENAAFNYENSFSCSPTAIPFRPARSSPKPVVYGTQTAVVVGQPGDEIFTDKYGRIKVQFHWDRDGKNDANSSCWVRVGSTWAGKQWGAIHIPRVGQEVLVAFQEGDPDQPIVIGSVYNAEQMPPYKLPDNKTQSGIKSRSTLQGGPANFNELRFEDKKGSEDIYFHAEKDFHRLVEHDDDLKVGNDQTIEIKNHRTEVVKEGNETITIEKGNRTETVKTGNELVTVTKGNRTVNVDTGNDLHQIKKGNRSVILDMGNDTHQIKQGNRNVLIDMGSDVLTIKMGDQTTKLKLGKSTTEAMQGIELKVGQSSIKLDQTGVTIKGMLVKIEGQVQTEVKGMMTTIKGDAMLTAKGTITMIN